MNLKDWETTIQQIVDESNRQPSDGLRDRSLIAWRSKLENEPTSLRPFQIDRLIREVRKRFTAVSR